MRVIRNVCQTTFTSERSRTEGRRENMTQTAHHKQQCKTRWKETLHLLNRAHYYISALICELGHDVSGRSCLGQQRALYLAQKKARPGKAPRRSCLRYWLRKSVAVGVCGLLVRHRTCVALATTRRGSVFAFAARVSILTLPLFLATRHGGVLATTLHVAASLSGLVCILRRIQGQTCCRNG